jgi:hypothetical protein
MNPFNKFVLSKYPTTFRVLMRNATMEALAIG